MRDSREWRRPQEKAPPLISCRSLHPHETGHTCYCAEWLFHACYYMNLYSCIIFQCEIRLLYRVLRLFSRTPGLNFLPCQFGLQHFWFITYKMAKSERMTREWLTWWLAAKIFIPVQSQNIMITWYRMSCFLHSTLGVSCLKCWCRYQGFGDSFSADVVYTRQVYCQICSSRPFLLLFLLFPQKRRGGGRWNGMSAIRIYCCPTVKWLSWSTWASKNNTCISYLHKLHNYHMSAFSTSVL